MTRAQSPDFARFSAIEEQILAHKLEAIREVLTHRGEKGRSVEGEIIAWLRTFVPAEYGLSTGFVVFHSPTGPTLSDQLDIIIYDAVRCGPIARFGTCDVFPLEAVYGYMEVKASLRSTPDGEEPKSNSIEKCILENKKVRSMDARRFWVPRGNTVTEAELRSANDWPAIRSYVVALSADGPVAADPKQFAQRLATYSAKVGKPAHLHGVLIAGSAFYITRPVDEATAKPEDLHHVDYITEHHLATFKWRLLHDLARFPRFPENCAPALDQYGPPPAWKSCAPQRG
jgi:hypothetical protein